ncbi:MAG TPA: peptidoglycan recognition family protein [Bryobacteraceae bacterium]|nr:peptidoglycan recognition family protein [Bryobacteraceae bacterium]
MTIRQPQQAAGQPWVDAVARHIGDPVTRLRFLKATLPALERVRRRRRLLRLLAPAIALAAILASLCLERAAVSVRPPDTLSPTQTPPPWKPAERGTPGRAAPTVWLVEKGAQSEVYSNGLRIDTRLTVATHPRSYLAFPREAHGPGQAVRRAEPVGIVFHSSESHQVPLEASQNNALKHVGESLLEYVRRRRAYHFVIDRFGRVFRIVNETDAADHAGYSVWADDRWEYVNLNESFLGVAFEGQSLPEPWDAGPNPAQIRSGGMLIEMLRSIYRIPEANCVTHAQVSVNPDNMRVGYHTDWVSGFPFQSLGLPENQGQLLPSVLDFGFEADAAFLSAASGHLRAGLAESEARVQEQAAAANLKVPRYRQLLRQRYRALLARVRG